MFNHFNLLAPVYERFIPPPDPDWLSTLLDLPVSGRMLDAGGGTGRVTRQIRELVGELYLCDIAFRMLKQAQGKRGVHLTMAQAEKLPFENAAFERIVVVDALHHFQDQRRAIGELLRVLAPGGRLIIEEPDYNHLGVKIVAALEKVALMQSRFYYPDQIGQIIGDFGYTASIQYDGKFSAWVKVDK